MGLGILIVGLVLFFGTHLVTTRRELRARISADVLRRMVD